MALKDAQKRAKKTYYEKNREKLLAYKSKYWQLNKHKWNRSNATPVSNEVLSITSEGGQRPPGSSAASPVVSVAMN